MIQMMYTTHNTNMLLIGIGVVIVIALIVGAIRNK